MALRIWSAFCWLGSLTEANWAVGQLAGTDVAVAVGGGVMDCAGAPGVWARADEASRRTSKCDAAVRMARMILERFLRSCIPCTGRAARSGPQSALALRGVGQEIKAIPPMLTACRNQDRKSTRLN